MVDKDDKTTPEAQEVKDGVEKKVRPETTPRAPSGRVRSKASKKKVVIESKPETKPEPKPEPQSPSGRVRAKSSKSGRRAKSISKFSALLLFVKSLKKKTLKQFEKHPSRSFGVLGAAVAVIVLIVVMSVSYSTAPKVELSGNVKALAMYKSQTRDVGDLKDQTTFKRADPIIVRFNYSAPGVSAEEAAINVYGYKVLSLTEKDDKGNAKVVRDGSVPIRMTDKLQERYISLVTDDHSALEVGEYSFELSSGEDESGANKTPAEIIAKAEFSVVE